MKTRKLKRASAWVMKHFQDIQNTESKQKSRIYNRIRLRRFQLVRLLSGFFSRLFKYRHKAKAKTLCLITKRLLDHLMGDKFLDLYGKKSRLRHEFIDMQIPSLVSDVANLADFSLFRY